MDRSLPTRRESPNNQGGYLNNNHLPDWWEGPKNLGEARKNGGFPGREICALIFSPKED